jgi:hypothetical protein
MNRIDIEPTPEGRIAAAAVSAMRHFTHVHKRLPDYADLREELRVHVVREILTGKLEGLRTPRSECEAKIREAVRELAALI